MRANFPRSLRFVLRWEGDEYTNDPRDPGGATNKGVTDDAYDEWLAIRGRDDRDRDVKWISENKAESLYLERYWIPAGCDDLAWPLDLVQFDTAVNMGVARAKRLLRESNENLDEYLRRRRAYYRTLTAIRPKLTVFLKGWLNRMDSLEKEAA